MGAQRMRPDSGPDLYDAGGAHVPEEHVAGAALSEFRQGIGAADATKSNRSVYL